MGDAVAGQLAAGLHSAGVRRIFGMPGGGPNLDMIGAAGRYGIDFTLAHGETAACIMAATYGLLTGTVGAVVVTRGPGLASAANGMAQATLDRFPLLAISDCVAADQLDRVWHQRLDQVGAARPLTKWSGVLGTRDPAAVVRAAVELAAARPAGAVHLAFDPSVPGDPPPDAPLLPAADPAALHRAVALAAGRRRPVVLVGRAAVAEADRVRAAVEGISCPVLVTYQAKGVVPDDWPQHAGLFTNAAIERPLLEQADLIVTVGLDPVEPLPNPWPYAAPVIALDAEAADAGYFGPATAVPGPLAASLPAVLAGLAAPSDWPAGTGGRIARDNRGRLDAPSPALSPLDVVRQVHAAAPAGSTLTVDAGAHMLAALPLWPASRPLEVLISNGLSTMGFSLPAAIGAALAEPGRRVVCCTGDGGLGMVLAELETLARLDLGVTVVAFNDAALSLIELKQRDGQGGAGAVRYGRTDFAGVARAMGVPAVGVRTVGELRACLTDLPAGPMLIDAGVDPAVYRHVIAVTRG